MRLRARNRIALDCEEACPVVAMLRPRSGSQQWVVAERYAIEPWLAPTEYVDAFGNLCQRFTLPRGKSVITAEHEVEVAEQIDVDTRAALVPAGQLPDETLQYMLQSRYCPSDMMCERAERIVKGCAPGYAQAQRIAEWIRENIEYKYGVSESSTGALETLKHKAGVCRDFSHVGIALCRSLLMPARFVVGYLHQLDPMDMHAWYEVFLGGRWFAFDATQAEPRGGRIVVAYGRDAADVAFLSNYGPLEITDMDVSVQQV
ncbi:transglutaminase family protein [Ramlibacter pallidus]|uniref:Transglutaminase family protein n=1 Tax=Ramlibacter pallidus TaxID=2780087 RepID=A0ABR9RZL5_9BURK|nr:transglutaminase family protein [Ramlibacter pallidus]MBE7366701.1 transglutaminase family protein [Ramlibacter pallidus]